MYHWRALCDGVRVTGIGGHSVLSNKADNRKLRADDIIPHSHRLGCILNFQHREEEHNFRFWLLKHQDDPKKPG